MCNVSLGIKEKAFDAGKALGISQGKIETLLELLREGMISLAAVAEKLELTEDEVKKMME